MEFPLDQEAAIRQYSTIVAKGLSLHVQAINFDTGAAFQELLEKCSDYSQITFGLPTCPADAQSRFLEGLQYVPEINKFLLGLIVQDRMIAAVDYLIGFPHRKAGSMALLVVHPEHRRLGIVIQIMSRVEAYMTALGMKEIFITGQVEENITGNIFLANLGYRIIERREAEVTPLHMRILVRLQKSFPG